HLRPPTRVTKVEPAGTAPLEVAEQQALRHHHLKTGHLPAAGDPVSGRVPLLFNDDVVLSRCRPAQPQAELYRNAAADEVIFPPKARGPLTSMFGVLPSRPYDSTVVPPCPTSRLDFDPGAQPDLLVVEASNNIVLPPRYLNPDGQIRL